MPETMRDVIHNIITFYEMRANALGVLVANTQKALKEFAPDKEEIANEQVEKLDNFVDGLTTELRDMLARFWFLKEREQKNHLRMTDDQVKKLTDFVSFVEGLTEDVRSLLTRFQEGPGQMFEQEFDKEVEQIQAYIKNRLKVFDEALTETNNAWKKRVGKSVSNVLGRIRKPLKGRLFSGALNINVANSNSEKQECQIQQKV
jgi:hypothetical protein